MDLNYIITCLLTKKLNQFFSPMFLCFPESNWPLICSWSATVTMTRVKLQINKHILCHFLVTFSKRMKARAPSPPQAPQPAPRNIFRTPVPEGGKPATDAKENMFRSSVHLQVTLPQGYQTSVTEDGRWGDTHKLFIYSCDYFTDSQQYESSLSVLGLFGLLCQRGLFKGAPSTSLSQKKSRWCLTSRYCLSLTSSPECKN